MLLEVWLSFAILSLVFIGLGFYRTEHSELPLVGFFFLFLLSFPIMGNTLEYESGFNENYIYTQDNSTLLEVNRTIVYTDLGSQSFNSHYFGYYLAVMSAVGFIGTLVGIGRTKKYDQD